jgi:uncharacterized DUF497 family protein
MNFAVDGFDWDAGNRAKCGRHGVPLAEIEALFAAEPLVAPDPAHSGDETRFIAVGRNAKGRPMFVAFTLRAHDGGRLIRPISARYMHAKEIKSYEARS